MKHFLAAHDVPNWACILLWLLAYMLMVCGEKLERMRQAAPRTER